MPRQELLPISKLRRAQDPKSMARRIGLILNSDGTVFDKMESKLFNNIIEWYKAG